MNQSAMFPYSHHLHFVTSRGWSFELSDSELVIKRTYVNGKLVYDASK